jgi:hypothetical protein
MKTTFVEADTAYRASLEAIGDLDSAFTAACAVGKVDLCGNELTRAILARMKSYYAAQEQIKTFLGKAYAAASADFFVETVAFYLKVAIKIQRLNLHVASETESPPNKLIAKFLKAARKVHELESSAELEKTVARRQAAMRPDISVWKNADLVAAIECKTQLGRTRNEWRPADDGLAKGRQDFIAREARLKERRPNARVFLLVMTEANWDSDAFRNDERFGKQFFVLLDKKHGKDHWPDLSAPTIAGLVHPIENLFRLILT